MAAYILIIAKPCITCCQRTTRTCWASRERVECRRQDTSNFVAAILRCPLHLRSLRWRQPARRPHRRRPLQRQVAAILRCTLHLPGRPVHRLPLSLALRPPRWQPRRRLVSAILRCPGNAPAPAAPAPAAAGAPPPATATSPKSGEVARGRTGGKLILFLIDERCAVVCRNRTAIQLPSEFHLLHSADQEKVMTGICKAYDHLIYT